MNQFGGPSVGLLEMEIGGKYGVQSRIGTGGVDVSGNRLEEAAQWVGDKAQQAWEGIKSGVGKAWDWTKGAARNVAENIQSRKEYVKRQLADIWGGDRNRNRNEGTAVGGFAGMSSVGDNHGVERRGGFFRDIGKTMGVIGDSIFMKGEEIERRMNPEEAEKAESNEQQVSGSMEYLNEARRLNASDTGMLTAFFRDVEHNTGELADHVQKSDTLGKASLGLEIAGGAISLVNPVVGISLSILALQVGTADTLLDYEYGEITGGEAITSFTIDALGTIPFSQVIRGGAAVDGAIGVTKSMNDLYEKYYNNTKAQESSPIISVEMPRTIDWTSYIY